MIKITVSLDRRIKELLARLATYEGRTESELIREAIAKLLHERGLLDPSEMRGGMEGSEGNPKERP